MTLAHPAVAAAYARHAGLIESFSAAALEPVRVTPAMLERTFDSAAYRPARIAANGRCRLLRAADGWLALNLARDEDLDLVPALLGTDGVDEPWSAIERHVAQRRATSFVARARLLGLAAARLGETRAGRAAAAGRAARPHDARPWSRAPRVVDLSALWAGPLASALLARAGCDVTRIDGRASPDRFGAEARPGIGRLDDGKRLERFRLDDRDGQRRLAALLDAADVVITAMRPRALAALGLVPRDWLARRPSLVWIAISAHGLTGAAAERVGFGDDCAVAGGLVDDRGADGPRFLGDALADPLTGLHAAATALGALASRSGGLHDVSLARTAAAAAAARRPATGAASC